MEIINVPIGDIRPYDKNPRRNDAAVEYVAESIDKFGFKVPIILDADNVIVAGHTRWKAAKRLGMDEVPCIVADDLSPEQIKAFRLADNKVAEAAEWDPVLLSEELQELADMFDVDMSAFGFVDENTVAEALDLDDDQRKDKDKTTCHCPKCGFVFEV